MAGGHQITVARKGKIPKKKKKSIKKMSALNKKKKSTIITWLFYLN